MKKISLIIFGIFLISLIGAFPICVDKDPPKWENGSLTLTSSGNNIQLTWTAATDVPTCSGISHYDIYRGINGGNLSLIGNTSNTNYLDKNLQDGTYTYMIHAIDLVGHLESLGISNTISLGGITPSGRRGGGAWLSFWECGEWGECINGTQTRTCSDIRGLQADMIETRECFLEFIPTGQESEENETLTLTTTPPGFFAGITGAVIGAFGTGGTVLMIGIILIIIVLAVLATRQSSVKARKRK